MNTYRPMTSSNYLLIALKILVLILGLYISIFVLARLFAWILGFVYILAKVAIFIIVTFLALHFFLKLLFRFDLIRFVVLHFRNR